MMPMMNNAPPMQGLQAARPEAPMMEEGGGAPPMEAAMSILKDAVDQFGPDIIPMLQQLLAGAGEPPAVPEATVGV